MNRRPEPEMERYTFTLQELQELGGLLAEAVGAYKRLEDEKKTLTKDLGKALKEQRARMESLAEKRREGYELREVLRQHEMFAGEAAVPTEVNDPGKRRKPQ